MPKPDWLEVAESIRRGIWDLKAWADLASDQEEERALEAALQMLEATRG